MLPIDVAKFGGTSLADADAIKASVARVTEQTHPCLVVVSACAGVTNRLVALCQSAAQIERQRLVDEIIDIHNRICQQLATPQVCQSRLNELHEQLQLQKDMLAIADDRSTRSQLRDQLLSFGERCSSELFAAFWRQATNNQVSVVAATELLQTDNQFGHARPDIEATERRCGSIKNALQQGQCMVTQGFIGATVDGTTTTLGRGGSDYSAAVLAAALGAKRLLIWTDVAGIYTTDPRICGNARPLTQISYAEAAELATFGAKVLHPKSLAPAIEHHIDVYVGHSKKPELGGTYIVEEPASRPSIRAIALRRKQTLLTVTSVNMLHATGFLARLFDVLARHDISVDLVTTSEVSIALTLDEDGSQANGGSMLPAGMLDELRQFATVEVEQNLALIAVIGNSIGHQGDKSADLLGSASPSTIRLICQGASRHNLCFLVAEEVADEVVKNLHKKL